MSLKNNRDWLKALDMLQILFALVMTIAYIYMITQTNYLNNWYLKIAVGVACFGALIGGILHFKNSKK